MKIPLTLFLTSLHLLGGIGHFGTSWNWEARKWAKVSVPAAGTSVSGSSYMVATVFMQHIDQWGLRSQIKQCQLYLGNGVAACGVPIINDFGATITFNAFVSGDFVESSGLTGGADPKYIGTGTGPTSINDGHVSVYITINVGGNQVHIGGFDSVNVVLLAPNDLGTTYGEMDSPTPGNYIAVSDTIGLGHYNMVRTASTNLVIYTNSVSWATSTNPGGSATTAG